MSADTILEIRGVLRAMAWERAKGELYSMLSSYSGEQEKFEALSELTNDFIIAVEGDGLHK